MAIKRRFLPGEEWAYLKIYGGPKILDETLTKEIFDLVAILYDKNIIEKFFFLRYFDDGHHLRLRFLLCPEHGPEAIFVPLSNKLTIHAETRLLPRLTLDTYVRELERYGTLAIESMETLFSVNSFECISMLRAEKGYKERWLLGVGMMDQWFERFGLTLFEKYSICQDYYASYANEFGISASIPEQFKKIYRESKMDIEYSIENCTEFQLPSPLCGKIISCIFQLREIEKLKVSEIPLDKLIRDFMHMHFNKVFRVKQRMHETVMYYLLSNYYKSALIREGIRANYS
jgi:thiopeptide-type bacteriocin biosynthesis protein